ncbi:hypothetical protein MYX07_01350 [Patescibacteria group bacterium AH-259-L07]|nr:hypothetical protein [Patescibacteria group bacterium AH-259-L07]
MKIQESPSEEIKEKPAAAREEDIEAAAEVVKEKSPAEVEAEAPAAEEEVVETAPEAAAPEIVAETKEFVPASEQPPAVQAAAETPVSEVETAAVEEAPLTEESIPEKPITSVEEIPAEEARIIPETPVQNPEQIKLANGQVRFKYDTDNNIIDTQVVTSSIRSGPGTENLSDNYREMIAKNPDIRNVTFAARKVEMISRALTNDLQAYEELSQMEGYEKQADAVLKTIHNHVDSIDRSMGKGVIDYSKIPGLEDRVTERVEKSGLIKRIFGRFKKE